MWQISYICLQGTSCNGGLRASVNKTMKTKLKNSNLRKKVEHLAYENGWIFICYQDDKDMISFRNLINGDSARINIYLTKMTVSTSLTHPRQGKTQLYRRNVDMTLLSRIFKNPRIHTDRGYQVK